MKPTWALPAVEWICALREAHEHFTPKRILIAGCGVGTEAFMIARQFPEAEVVGVDFSKRSIDTANKLLPKKLSRRVRLIVGDLTSPDLARATGSAFDLVTCHGVLSYIPDTRAVLRNFERVLSADGVLILDVNGAAHPSVRLREMLPKFGVSPEIFSDDAEVRDVLRIGDCFITYPPLPMADRDAGYLAGDIFGPLNHSLPFSRWAGMLDDARLHVLGTYHAYFVARDLFNHDLHLRLMPRSRREITDLAEELQPASFHQMVVSRRKPAEIPWAHPKQLLDWRPSRTHLFSYTWPKGSSAPQNLRSVRLKSPTTNTRVELSVPQWEVDVVRRADGRESLGELLATVKGRVAPTAVAEAMYLLYLMGAANLLPPEHP